MKKIRLILQTSCVCILAFLITVAMVGCSGQPDQDKKGGSSPGHTQARELSEDVYLFDFKDNTLGSDSRKQLVSLILAQHEAKDAPAGIEVDYPLSESLFPPDIVAPTVHFHDSSPETNLWLVDISIEGQDQHVFMLSDQLRNRKEPEIDPRCATDANRYEETEYQATELRWEIQQDIWDILTGTREMNIKLKLLALKLDPTSDFSSFTTLTSGQTTLKISSDPVGAPIFYRDVPLMPSETKSGLVKPLAQDALPLIEWRLRDLTQARSKVIMKGLPTCGNCHSFSLDGKTLGMDMDGPTGDKGSYAVVPVSRQISIESEHVMSWNKFNPEKVTFGLFSRVSPDGQHVVSSVDEAVFVTNYMQYQFLQTFYPSRAKLAIYSRETNTIKTLPGADDPEYVQCNAVWSPDGNTLAFLRAQAIDPYRENDTTPTHANDPNELQIKYDIYTIPFNNGSGGEAKPLAGAANNGKSNSFPKYSPDGKWIVFVQANNGLLMRPDSELHIVPAEGGKARRLESNTERMNSWHSWSPNSRWLVFSSKANTPFTQMFITHIDEKGNDSPAILVPNSTPANRAVNLPEFVNIHADGMDEILAPAVEYRHYLDRGEKLIREKNFDAALKELQKSLELKPDFATTLEGLGYIMKEQGDLEKAIDFFNRALKIEPGHLNTHNYLGVAYLQQGNSNRAKMHFEYILSLDPEHFEAHNNLGFVLSEEGNHNEAYRHFQRALEIKPDYANAQFNLGLLLSRAGKVDEALPYLKRAVDLNQDDGKSRNALAMALNRQGEVKQAIIHYEKAIEINADDLSSLNNLAWILATSNDASIRNGKRAVQLAEHLCRATDFKVAGAIDTLAAAYAENGQFDLAVKNATLSVRMTDKGDANFDIRTYLLDLYKKGSRYRIK